MIHPNRLSCSMKRSAPAQQAHEAVVIHLLAPLPHAERGAEDRNADHGAEPAADEMADPHAYNHERKVPKGGKYAFGGIKTIYDTGGIKHKSGSKGPLSPEEFRVQ